MVRRRTNRKDRTVNKSNAAQGSFKTAESNSARSGQAVSSKLLLDKQVIRTLTDQELGSVGGGRRSAGGTIEAM
jgi:hypothetical protein